MDLQTLFNYLAGIIGALVMWIMKGIKDDITDLKNSDTSIKNAVQLHELHVARGYVTRAELKDSVDSFNDKLDTLFEKLDKKEDRRHG